MLSGHDKEVNGIFVPGVGEAFICSTESGGGEDHYTKCDAKIMLIYKRFLACRPQHVSETRDNKVQEGQDISCCD